MNKNGIAQKILNLRIERKLNQKQFGEKLGYFQQVVSKWENGNSEPDIETIKKIAKLFDVSYEELLD